LQPQPVAPRLTGMRGWIPIVATLGMTFVVVASGFAQQDEPTSLFIPEEGNPFFVPRQEFTPGSPESAQRISQQFPRNRDADLSAGKMFTSFFTDMFASVKIGGGASTNPGSSLDIDPKTFSLDDRREFTVNYVIHNRTRDVLRLDFPNAQRIEITVTDPAGKVVERWSDDRLFAEVTGVVMINPGERIEYSERIPTREMVPGKTYVIEASVTNHPQFTKTVNVTPLGTPDQGAESGTTESAPNELPRYL